MIKFKCPFNAIKSTSVLQVQHFSYNLTLLYSCLNICQPASCLNLDNTNVMKHVIRSQNSFSFHKLSKLMTIWIIEYLYPSAHLKGNVCLSYYFIEPTSVLRLKTEVCHAVTVSASNREKLVYFV